MISCIFRVLRHPSGAEFYQCTTSGFFENLATNVRFNEYNLKYNVRSSCPRVRFIENNSKYTEGSSSAFLRFNENNPKYTVGSSSTLVRFDENHPKYTLYTVDSSCPLVSIFSVCSAQSAQIMLMILWMSLSWTDGSKNVKYCSISVPFLFSFWQFIIGSFWVRFSFWNLNWHNLMWVLFCTLKVGRCFLDLWF